MLIGVSWEERDFPIDLTQRMSTGVPEGGKFDILAKSSPGCEALTEEWTIVAVTIYSFDAAEDGIVNLGIVLCLKFDRRQSPP